LVLIDLMTNYIIEDYINKHVIDHIIEKYNNQYHIIIKGYVKDHIDK